MSNLTVKNCNVKNNNCVGIFPIDSNTCINGSVFSDNKRNRSGSSQTLPAFAGGGGAVVSYGGSVQTKNCTFVGNKAGRGNSIYLRQNKPHALGSVGFSNSIFASGRETTGLEICISSDMKDKPVIQFCYNTIVGGLAQIGDAYTLEPIPIAEIGCIDVDPCFVVPGYWDANYTPTDANDDFWVDGDYHLLPQSLCINTGDPNYIREPNETDLDCLPRVIGGRIDMGAYEFNHCPIPDAGPNQIAYAWLDNLADVNLDGSDSYDDDGDLLDYYWFWSIGPNLCEANSVSPCITLPIGQHQIQLIVDDGIDESEPAYCTITVIEPLNASLSFWPSTINCNAKPNRILALMQLPRDIEPEDVKNEPLTVYLYNIQSKYQRVYKLGRGRYARTFVMAVFNRDDICNALQTPGRHQLKIAGRLTTGQYFYGTDTITILKPRPHPWPFYPFRHH